MTPEAIERRRQWLQGAALRFGLDVVEGWVADPAKRGLINAMMTLETEMHPCIYCGAPTAGDMCEPCAEFQEGIDVARRAALLAGLTYDNATELHDLLYFTLGAWKEARVGQQTPAG